MKVFAEYTYKKLVKDVKGRNLNDFTIVPVINDFADTGLSSE